MKLATYKDGSRDGQLVVVARDLATAHYATGVASRLQQALDDWNFIAPQLQDLFDALNAGRARHAFPFDSVQCMAPLPRAYQWIVADAGARHPAPEDAGGQNAAADAAPWMCQGGSDDFLGPRDDIWVQDEASGVDFGPALAVVSGEVPMAATTERGLDAVRLLLLANDIRLRQLDAHGPAAHCPPLHARPSAAFGPVAVTPDELGDAWQGGRVHLTLQTSWNGRKFSRCDAGTAMPAGFGELLAQAARTRRLRAGTIVGAGMARHASADGRRESTPAYASIADKRASETLQDGAPTTGYLRFGDTVRIEVKGASGQSVFGAIEQRLVQFAP